MFWTNSKEGSTQAQGFIQQDMTLEQVRVTMLQLKGDESINHHRMGQLYNYVVDRKLAELANFKDAADYFRQNLRDISPATLTMYGAVARGFSEEVARQFGVTCLSLLLSYKKLTNIQVDREQPGNTIIEVPDKKGVVVSKPFSACTVEDMRRALQHKRQPPAGTPLTQEDVALADQLDTAVKSRFDKADPVRIQLLSREGVAVLSIDVPLSKWETLKEALVAHSANANAAPKVKPPSTS